MTIILSVEELLRAIKQVSHREVAEIADVEARYRAEAGTEKEQDIFRAMVEASSALRHRVRRYLRAYYQQEADNQLALPESFVYEFSMSERRSDNKTQPLTDHMNSFIVHLTLAKFYANVSQTELSNKHSQFALAEQAIIEDMIYYKQPPMP